MSCAPSSNPQPPQHIHTVCPCVNALSPQQHTPEARSRSRWYGPGRPQLPASLGGRQPHLTGAVAGARRGLTPAGGCTQRQYHRGPMTAATCPLSLCCLLLLIVQTRSGDYGFDPLQLAAEPAKFERAFEAELLHAR
jgi:hypothetical protein